MIRKSLDLPPGVAKAFVKDMQAYFAEEDGHRRDAHSRAPASRTQSAPGSARKAAWTVRREAQVHSDE